MSSPCPDAHLFFDARQVLVDARDRLVQEREGVPRQQHAVVRLPHGQAHFVLRLANVLFADLGLRFRGIDARS